MKTLNATLLAAFLLVGCSNDRGPRVVGISVPDVTTATLLTDLPAQQVASCIAGGLRASAQPHEGGYLVTGTGDRPVTYRIRPIQDRLERFVTQVEQVGTAESGGFIAATCLAPSGAGA